MACLDEQEYQLAKIREGLADAKAGRVVSHEEVVRWLAFWGTENELNARGRIRLWTSF